jgi:hypothetical protein
MSQRWRRWIMTKKIIREFEKQTSTSNSSLHCCLFLCSFKKRRCWLEKKNCRKKILTKIFWTIFLLMTDFLWCVWCLFWHFVLDAAYNRYLRTAFEAIKWVKLCVEFCDDFSDKIPFQGDRFNLASIMWNDNSPI